MARSPNTVAGVEAAGDPAVSPVDNADVAAAAVTAPVVDPADLLIPGAIPESATPTVSIPSADRAVAGGPGTVRWRDQGGIELTVKTN